MLNTTIFVRDATVNPLRLGEGCHRQRPALVPSLKLDIATTSAHGIVGAVTKPDRTQTIEFIKRVWVSEDAMGKKRRSSSRGCLRNCDTAPYRAEPTNTEAALVSLQPTLFTVPICGAATLPTQPDVQCRVRGARGGWDCVRHLDGNPRSPVGTTSTSA